MAHHHDHHTDEKKPVAFTVPFILATVTLIAMLLLLSLCDPRHGHCECVADNCSKECMEACEKGDHSKHPEKHGVDHSAKAADEERVPKDHIAPAHDAASDTTKNNTPAADTTHKHEEGHH